MNIEELTEKVIHSVHQKDNLLGHGVDGVVYAVDESVVLKSHRSFDGYNHRSSRNSAAYEFDIGNELHQQGVQVPQYHGLFKPIKLSFWGAIWERTFGVPSLLNCYGVFMERIYGVRPSTLPSILLAEARCQYQQQQELLGKLGYMAKDSWPDHNVLFDVKKKDYFFTI